MVEIVFYKTSWELFIVIPLSSFGMLNVLQIKYIYYLLYNIKVSPEEPIPQSCPSKVQWYKEITRV